jgi:hypothetical protein
LLLSSGALRRTSSAIYPQRVTWLGEWISRRYDDNKLDERRHESLGPRSGAAWPRCAFNASGHMRVVTAKRSSRPASPATPSRHSAARPHRLQHEQASGCCGRGSATTAAQRARGDRNAARGLDAAAVPISRPGVTSSQEAASSPQRVPGHQEA